jgi:glycosyltransferase involved in cell wall biosynthesis
LISSNRLSVSFVVPVRNDANRLTHCLNTIRSNRYPPELLEIVVVDNGSTDDSVAVAKKANAKVLVMSGVPVGELRNRGTQVATGDILAFVDADHEITSRWVEHAVELLQQPNVGAVGALCEAPDNGTWVQRTYDLLRRRTAGTCDVEWLGTGNMAVWRSAFEAAGRFDTRLQTCEDVDLCHRLRRRGLRIINDSRLRNVHFGDPGTLADLFGGELWRGRDNLRVSLRGGLTPRELPSIVIPIAVLGLLALSMAGLVVGGFVGLWVTIAALFGILSAAVARALRMVLGRGRVRRGL